MTRILFRTVFLLTLSSALAPRCRTPGAGQAGAAGAVQASAAGGQQPAAARRRGVIFRDEVDGLIAAISRQTAKAGAAAPYSASLLEAAQILCAMGHCHRFYVAVDHP